MSGWGITEHDDHSCAPGQIEEYRRIDLPGGVIVQLGVCEGCREVIARRYVVTGPETGPWRTLALTA